MTDTICPHVASLTDLMVYRPPPRRDGDLKWRCPCCDAIVYAKPDETLPPCPWCDQDALPA